MHMYYFLWKFEKYILVAYNVWHSKQTICNFTLEYHCVTIIFYNSSLMQLLTNSLSNKDVTIFFEKRHLNDQKGEYVYSLSTVI